MLQCPSTGPHIAGHHVQAQPFENVTVPAQVGPAHPTRMKRSGGDAAAAGRPTRGESGPSLFSIELAGRYKGVKLQIVAIDKFALE